MTIVENRPETDEPADKRFRVRGSAVCSDATSQSWAFDDPVRIELLSFAFQSWAE